MFSTHWFQIQNPSPLPSIPRSSESIKRFSEKDAARWPEFVRFMNKSAKILEKAYSTIMPRLPMNFNASEGFGLMDLGLNLRLAGRKDMLNFIRALPMTAQELVEEYFESEVVKGCSGIAGNSWIHPGSHGGRNRIYAHPQLAEPRRACAYQCGEGR